MDNTALAFAADVAARATVAAKLLNEAAAAETDPSAASHLRAQACVMRVSHAMHEWAGEQDGRITVWALHVCGRLLSNPALLAELAPQVLDLPEHAAA